ncbi:uncharacterized protein LOC106662193 isoform X2 [Cimex lectularius]|uniref:Uncharacterized protein n=1 Tax=Cimex lectularius TaxID=79782 RepID=A0A8I6TIE3_CIMLE|nr:uncharacterized protein LOC106662193 isoform X2 [Cimex lectularius]
MLHTANIKGILKQAGMQMTINSMSRTIQKLENSVKISTNLEQKMFQNEIQLLIDKHKLSLDLDKEKYKISKLKQIANVTVASVKSVKNVTFDDNSGHSSDLVRVLKKKDLLLNKSTCEIKKLSKENIRLNTELQHEQSKVSKLKRDNQVLSQFVQHQMETKSENQNYEEKCAILTLKLKESDCMVKKLVHRNNILTQELHKKSSNKRNSKTQVCEMDFVT